MKTKTKKRCTTKSNSIEYQALKELRLELGLTLSEASSNMSLGPKGLGAIENGRVSLDKNRIEEIIACYNLTYLNFIKKVKLIEKEQKNKKRKQTIRSVLTKSDRRSYQKIITKECKVLRSMRKSKSLSQDQASKLCGYPRSTIGHVENGRIELSNSRIKHIIHCYGYSFQDFEDNMKKDEQRDKIEEFCIDKIKTLSEEKLIIIRNLIDNF